VRAATASALYEHTLANEEDLPVGNADEAAALLVGTVWDGTDAKAARDALLAMYGFEPPTVQKVAARPKQIEEDKTFGTYTDLVQTMGY
jgi:hypothetical protein